MMFISLKLKHMKNNRAVYLMLMIVLLMKITEGQEVIYADIEREGSEIVPKLCHQSYTVQVVKRYELSEEVINELMPRDLYNYRTIQKTYRDMSTYQYPVGYDVDESIYIGHSLGGVIAIQMNLDEVEYSRDKYFGALATFGSPLQGAPVTTNEGQGCLIKMVEEGCNKLLTPYFKKFISNFSVVNFGNSIFYKGLESLVNEALVDYLKDKEPIVKNAACKVVKNAGIFISKKLLLPEIGRDLDPNGPVIQSLKEHEMDIPVLTVYGEEDAPVSLREIYSLEFMDVNRPDLDRLNPSPPTSKYFTADYDEGLIDIVENLTSHLEAKERFYRVKEECGIVNDRYLHYLDRIYGNNIGEDDMCEMIGGEYNIETRECRVFCGKYDLEVAEAFREAAQWLRDFDDNYLLCFGLVETDVAIQKYRKNVCRCYQEIGGKEVLKKEYDKQCRDVDPNPWTLEFDCRDELKTEIKVDMTTTKVPSDGVVSTKSASTIKVQPDKAHYTFPAKGSNHQQMRNDKNAGEVFREMYRGIEYGKKFKLEKR